MKLIISFFGELCLYFKIFQNFRERIYYSFPFYYCINPKSEKNTVADKGLFFSTNIIRNVSKIQIHDCESKEENL